MTGWTDERVEQLKALKAQGLPASQIARLLGGVTRDAVISKLQRLDGRARHKPRLQASEERPRVPMTPKAPVRAHAPAVEEDPVVLDDGSFATVLTINDRMCRWPIGDPSENEFHFCGRKPKNGSPYCEVHARKAYQPQKSNHAVAENASSG